MRQGFALLLAALVTMTVSGETRIPEVFYIPAAGEAVSDAVRYSTQFRVTNLLGVPQAVRVDWIARDGLGAIEKLTVLKLGPNVTDIITGTDLFAGAGPRFGAVRFTAIEDDGSFSPFASITGEALIVGLRRSDSARLTQTVAAVPLEEMRGGNDHMTFYPVPLRTNRANYGIVNDSAMPGVFEVEARDILSSHGLDYRETVVVPAQAMTQRPLNIDSGPETTVVTVKRVDNAAGLWTAYVSSIDRITSDAVLVSPLPANGTFDP